MSSSVEILFSIKTPLGFVVRTTKTYWAKVIEKHPDMEEHLSDVKKALSKPDEVRKSRKAGDVLLFYRKTVKHWVVAVTKHRNNEGYLITAYQTDNRKEGEVLWHR